MLKLRTPNRGDHKLVEELTAESVRADFIYLCNVNIDVSIRPKIIGASGVGYMGKVCYGGGPVLTPSAAELSLKHTEMRSRGRSTQSALIAVTDALSTHSPSRTGCTWQGGLTACF